MSQPQRPTNGELFTAGCSIIFLIPVLALVLVLIVAIFMSLFS